MKMSRSRTGCSTSEDGTVNPLELGLGTGDTVLRPRTLKCPVEPRASEGAEGHSVGTVMARELSYRRELSEKSATCESSTV